MPSSLPVQFHHLFPLDDEAVIHHAVPVVVAQEPVIELAPPLDHLEEVRQPVRGVVSIQLLLDAGGGAVGQDAVYFPVDPFQVPDGFLIFLLRGQLLGPPGDTLHPEYLPCPALEPVFPLKVGGRRIEDAVLDVVGGSAAHGEEGNSTDLEDLPAHQVEYMGPDVVDFSSLPLMDGKFTEPVEVVVVPVHKEGGKGLFLQPVEPVCLFGRIVPYTPEIAGNDRIVITAHLLLLGKVVGAKPLETAMGVALSRCKNYSDVCYKTVGIANCG